MRSLHASLRAYRVVTGLLGPLTPLLLEARAKRGKEDPARMSERRGIPGRPRPPGPLAWLHGASVGESLSLLPLVERLVQSGLAVMVTTGTVSSANLIERRLPPGSFHHYVPLDVPSFVRRFLDHWRPDLALFAESELWPNLIIETERRGIPLVSVNARMSERSFRRWQRFSGTISDLLGRFTMCLAQSDADADRLLRLGAERVGSIGNLKFEMAPPPADPMRVSTMSGLIAGRPVWVAASTHPGEDELITAVHRTLAPHFPGLLTIIAPRHVQRGPEIGEIAEEDGLRWALRSRGHEPDSTVDVYIADTMGELGLFFRVAPIVFMGGTLAPVGGHNPIEPGKLGTAAIIHGPHVHNFVDVFAAFDRDRAALAVNDAQGLAQALGELIPDGARIRAMSRAALHTCEMLGGALDRTMQAIEPLVAAAHDAAR